MFSENETIKAMSDFFESVAERAERAEKRLRNDDEALQRYGFLNLNLVSVDELAELHAAAWKAVQRINFSFDYISQLYWSRKEGREAEEDE